MQLKSFLLALALGAASAQAWTIHGYTEKDCKGTADTAGSGSGKEACGTMKSSTYKSLKASPGDYVLTAYSGSSCSESSGAYTPSEGYALQPARCVNGDFDTYEAQFIAIGKRDNETAIDEELVAAYYAEFPEELDELK
ncbi:hypothetical protein BO70DRAFT_399995 [Aspergillus heteromorphus CBS 117.55]|uniref:Uncharacterized protein n=1 Tax=Aspergillus heteromorphus CBS 117.55 TaxID=1448321 RepID=A0A317V6Z9_9EURO|nr:uncharacterized protein BO70DRAFT_399995 [Aspergillus heteromorphus CBS 117.55]PWY69795.1 hypothetical protein BO70DRAFT_399995 [Aspergillus heteromorphus CBS 117.55]